jgi:hypothetical protein
VKRKVTVRELEVGICSALRLGQDCGMWGVDVGGFWGRRRDGRCLLLCCA